MSASPHLQAHSLTRSFQIGRNRIEVLREVSLDVQPAESVFLCGASGAGKTTLLYTLAGLETPERGSVHFEGQSLYELSSDRLSTLRNARMGFVFQAYFLLPELTALENVLLPALIGKTERRQEALALLERVGLGNRLDHLPSELSGGEQQRVAIARALINNPGIVFADEPTGNLDSQSGAAIVQLLLDLVRQDGRTLVVVTHDTSLARRGDRLLHVQDGRVVEQ
jgi:putative ABC transport system ATP-binding protein/lipoprotein-releasing system ATP-binding protein